MSLCPSFPSALALPQLPRLVIPDAVRGLLSNVASVQVFLLFAALQLAMAWLATIAL